MKNWMLCIIDGNYPSQNGTSTLVGIYPTKKELEFIQNVLLERATNLKFSITETDYPATTKSVGHFLNRRKIQLENNENKDNQESIEVKSNESIGRITKIGILGGTAAGNVSNVGQSIL